MTLPASPLSSVSSWGSPRTPVNMDDIFTSALQLDDNARLWLCFLFLHHPHHFDTSPGDLWDMYTASHFYKYWISMESTLTFEKLYHRFCTVHAEVKSDWENYGDPVFDDYDDILNCEPPKLFDNLTLFEWFGIPECTTE